MRALAATAALAAALTFTVIPAGTAAAVTDPAQYVNAFVGTRPGGPDFGNGGGAGMTFPGADAPFGMLQWSPDTVTHQHGGYTYDDNRIKGFSLTHISGPGCSDFGNIPFLPTLGSSPVSQYTFNHANESASPGYYAVTFDNGLKTELTTTQRTGMARFTYPAGQRASLSVDAGKAFNAASGSITIGTNSLTGFTDGGGFCGAGNRYRIYFTATFDRPFATSGVAAADGKVDTTRKSISGASKQTLPASPKTAQQQSGVDTRKAPAPSEAAADPAIQAAAAFVSFDTSSNPTVTARVAISFVSLAGAQANLSSEQGSRSFDDVRSSARGTWNGLLGRVNVTGGTDAQLRTLYTAIYHSFLHPNVFSDVDGRYMGFDNQVHSAASGHQQYANYSGWDVYRSQVALVALLAPNEAADIAQSAINQDTYGGYFDRWTVANGGTGVMNGDPVTAIISTMYAFGATNFNASDGLKRIVTGVNDVRERPGWLQYNQFGYVPTGLSDVWGSAATTLEYTSADFAISQLAARLGDTANAEYFLRRAQNWRSLFESGSKYIQPRNTDTTFPGFSPTQQDQYTEGNGGQYTWMVPYNYRGLFDAMGGNAAVTPRLDAFFTDLNAGPDKNNAYLGNEPTLETPWAYAYAGAPYKTQDIVRRALTTNFKPLPEGMVGNDDLGEMSSWAVWAILGMYPEAPGRSELVLASPQFPAVTITRGNGKTITINAPGASDSAKYVQSLKVNGQTSTKAWLPESFVANGGTLDYTLGTAPNTSWGAAAADAPPSFDVGPAPARTGAVTGLASKCLDGDPSQSGNGAAVRLWDCNSSAAQQWTLASDGTVRALGRCLDVSASKRDNGTKVQLWDCNGTGAQQWWPKAGGALVNSPAGKCLDVPNSNTANGIQLQIYDCNSTGAQIWRLP
ncbi:lectin [Actinocrispum wychmicini]|uniref:Putative alpha-1,2-mannosidase n=1 Tax=Actinocrispum wychmicini TaxID=1213861 RepID=A0A4V2S449_9PSEU|nr:lectin [Actinocrispum wychmicini]TCO46530.1 putative alpha-1,2-mannosidase [Actinocrispum wychmicini]